jgi:hypothetical protein
VGPIAAALPQKRGALDSELASLSDANSESSDRGNRTHPLNARRSPALPSAPMANRDEDDWVGTPPEGRHTRDRANPGFWQNQWQAAAAGSVLFVLLVIVLLLALL